MGTSHQLKTRNAHNQVVRYIARLVAKGYIEIPRRDYDEPYAPVMDAITYRYKLGFSLGNHLAMRQMDVVTIYLCGMLDTTIYMKASPKLISSVQTPTSDSVDMNVAMSKTTSFVSYVKQRMTTLKVLAMYDIPNNNTAISA